MNRSPAFRSWLVALAASVAAVLLCIAYVDRPVVDFVQAHVRRTSFADTVNSGFPLLIAAMPLPFLALFAAGIRAIAGRPLPAWASTPVTCSWSAVWALALTQALKHAIGRSAADPVYVIERIHAFHPLQGNPPYNSFPSGTMAVSSAIVGVLWVLVPRLRVASATVLATTVFALVVTNSHWISDIVAGTFLGASIAWMTVLLRSAGAPDRGAGVP